ncbi:adhesion G-protein coupled receptor G2-like isoform X2 [Colossoma macropomum]|uniref:adhesion G-protein coupled receptor G2-like isoform X2 n=1 Tax=Colossoma macropomum TaxID=42526 RepID=UPI001864D38F|nr:adhesion G-protein coupled receptor G2-like isoform X2 [Colossoma macropomum]
MSAALSGWFIMQPKLMAFVLLSALVLQGHSETGPVCLSSCSGPVYRFSNISFRITKPSLSNASLCAFLKNVSTSLHTSNSMLYESATNEQCCRVNHTVHFIRETLTTLSAMGDNNIRVDMIFRSSTSNLTLLSFNLSDDDFILMDLGSFVVTKCRCNSTTGTSSYTSTTATMRSSPETPSSSSVTTSNTGTKATDTRATVRALTTNFPETGGTNTTSITNSTASNSSAELNTLLENIDNLLNGSTINSTVAKSIINGSSKLIDNLESTEPTNRPDTKMLNKLINNIEQLLQKLEVNEEPIIIPLPSLTLGVKKVNGTNFQKTSFTMTDSGLQVDGGSTNGSTPQGSIVLPASILKNFSPEEKKQVSKIQFCFYQKTSLFQHGAPSNNKLVSGVLASSVANLNISRLQENVSITLRNTKSVSSDKNVFCTFWRYDLNSGSGGWSSDGCTVLSSTENETVCSCDHLTNFGVLLDFSNQSITSYQQVIILNTITYIGCGISSVFLMVTLAMYLRSEKLRNVVPNKILIQLCFALLLLNLVFFLDSLLAKQLDSVGLCIPTVFFLSYFLLVSFTWVALESVHIYLTIVKVFNNYVAHFMVKVTLVGWGVPLVVVIIPVAIDKSVYGITSTMLDNGSVEYFCWWKDMNVFRIVVGTYFSVTYLMNFSMFIVVLTLMCRIKKKTPHLARKRTVLHDIWSVTALAVLLGLTWIFGLFSWGSAHLVFTYLSAICNSLQGFFIFVFRCAAKEEIRRQWRKHFMLGELPERAQRVWSRVTTSVLSFRFSSTTQESNVSRSKFDSYPDIGDTCTDRTITQEPTSDVDMNSDKKCIN